MLKTTFLTCLLFSFSILFAQEQCGSDAFHKESLKNPSYKLKMDKFEDVLKSPGGKRNYRTVGGTTVYTIPVVLHIMHKGEAEGSGTNISKASIINGIKALNERYRKIAGSFGDGNGVDVGIEFALAVRDPNGNCTDGIVRYNMSADATYMQYGVGTGGITDGYLKSLSFWNSNNYYNIWVVSEIDNNGGGGGTQGYAYFAGMHGSPTDGAVMLTSCITNTAKVTLAHELGHALNLFHTFEGDAGGSTCPLNATCSTDGDKVCDTPPHIRSNNDCPTGTNSCDGGSSKDLYYHNYMDYSADGCQNEFTAGQKARILAALTTTRASLLEENGNMSLIPSSSPTVDFVADKSLACSGSTAQFTETSFCIPNIYINSIGWNNISFNWTITNNAGTTLNSTVQNPSFTFNNAGTYDATLAITTSFGTTSYTKRGILVITSAPIAATCTGANSSPTSNFGYGIYEVNLNTLSHTSSGTYGDIQSGVTNGTGYGDFSCAATTILKPNTSYTISIKGNSNPSNGEDMAVYIDYNNDGDFVDAGEQIMYSDNVLGSSAYLTQNFTTPASPTFDVPLRMRVFSARGAETITPCFTTSRGQIQDYAVIISNKVASVSIAAAPSSTITYGTNVTFNATPVNGGTTPTYKWYLNDVLQTGFTGASYNNNTLLNGDKVYCMMTSNLSGVIASPSTSNTVTMSVTGPPLSDFTQDKLMTCAGGTVVFTDKSLLAPTSWSWSFPGGTPSTSTSQNPSVVYNTAGTYNVTLIAGNANGTGTTKTKTALITVYNSPAAIGGPFIRTNAPFGGIGITNVTVNTINNSTPYNDPVYNDFACSNFTSLTQGNTYSISVTRSSSNSQWLRAYIDYNGNNSFLDAGETIFAPFSGSGTITGTFIVPGTTVTGTILRMRIITDFSSSSTAGPTTTPLGYGQVEDYGVIINTGTSIVPTITYSGATKVYGDIPFAMTATSNSPGAMTYSITSGASFASINASTGQVTILGAGTVSVQVTQAASGTYAAATKTATLTINKANLTATASPASRVYNTTNPVFTISYSGFVNGDNASVVTVPTTSTTAITSSNVGTYPITLTGGSAANYTITLANGTLTVTPATPTLAYTGPTAGTVGSVLALTATTNSTATPTYSVVNGTGTATLAGSNLTLNTSGTVTLTVSVAANGNYSAATVNQTITINSLITPSITYNGATKTYGNAPFAMTAASNSPGAMTYSITSGASFASINASTGQVTIIGAGTVTVQVSQAVSGTYAAATKTATLTINKASLTATANAASRVYNTANPAFTITYSGFVNGDNATAITAPTASTTAITTSNVGTYPISLTGGSATNYIITLANGTLTVTQATPTLTYTGSNAGTVGSVLALTATTNSTATPTYSVVNGTGTATLAGSNLTLNTAGTVTLTVLVAANGNYAAATVNQTITINSLTTPSITYNNATKVYGDSPFAMTATSNSPGAMTYSITSGSSFASINASTGQVTILGTGTVTVQVAQAASGTYSATTKTATLTINKANLTATASPASRVYNTTNPVFTITYTGFVNGDNATAITAPTASTTAITSSNVGSYPITLTGGSAANYTITLTNGTLTVTPATPTLAYSGPNAGTLGSVLALTATTSSTATPTYIVANGTGTATLTGSNLTLNTAGTVTLTVSVAANGNYAAATVNQTITINTLTTPSITYNNVTKVYGDVPFAMTATSTSPGAMTYSITAGASFASINASTGQVTILGSGTVTVQVSQAVSGTYAAATKTATLTINKANLTATANPASRVYNTTNPVFTISYSGFVNGDNASVVTAPTASTTAITSSNVGSYPITLTGGSAANYAITLANGTLTVTPATPTLAYIGPTSGAVDATIAMAAITNSTAIPTFSVANGSGTASLSGSDLTLNTAGTVNVTVSVAATTNYTAATINQTITINNLPDATVNATFGNSGLVGATIPLGITTNSTGTITYTVTDGTGTASLNGNQLTLSSVGTVTVTITVATDGTYATTTFIQTINISNVTSLVNPDDTGFKVYPSVAENTATLEFTNLGNGVVSITDIKGVEQSNFNYRGESEIKLDVSNWPAGMYVIKLQTLSGEKVTKLMKQ